MLGCIGVVQYNLEILDLVCLNGGYFFFCYVLLVRAMNSSDVRLWC